jgi:hypothetical protein
LHVVFFKVKTAPGFTSVIMPKRKADDLNIGGDTEQILTHDMRGQNEKKISDSVLEGDQRGKLG